MAGAGADRLARTWRRFRRRPVAVQSATVVVAIAVVVSIVIGVSAGGKGHGSPSATTSAPAGVTSPDQASTSSAGVTAHTINVVFPVSNLTSLSASLGFAGDAEYGEQTKAIELFVKTINDAGGINGRRINAMIVNFDPTNEVGMRSLCKQWTEGGASVFAVLDGLGTWTGDNQLCITQEGHTPLISQWTTVSNYTASGSPYLWWTGPDDAAILQATVDWGLSSGRLGHGVKVGVIAGDRASDQLALDQYLLPDLRRAGITAVVKTIAADPNNSATTGSEAPLVIQQLRAAGVTSVIPLMPFNVFFPVLSAESQQKYFPTLLLSDYEESIESALGLIPVPYLNALNGQEGVTTETLGGVDDPRPQAQGGYDPGVRACWVIWHKTYPQTPPGNLSDFIEEQGPVQGWCQAIRLFTAAATAAGPHLDRRTFVEAMSKISNFPGGYSPILSYGPARFSGPSLYQVVRLHNNVPQSSQCKMPMNHIPQGVCWVSVSGWKPLPTTAP
jgi:ABC-type branched-subunit amino acid transport system substrate-binding protein